MEIKKRRGIGLTVVALALLFCVITTITLAGAAVTVPVVEVVPADQTVTAGQPFSVDVWVKDVTDMGADQAVLNFDHGAMQATEIVEGDFLASAGATQKIVKIDNTNGTAEFFYALQVEGANVTGDGILATINFDTDPAAAPGKYPLNLTDVLLADGHGVEIDVGEISNGTVTIIQPVPGLSGTGMVVVIGVLAIVLAISVGATRKRRK